MSRTIKLVGLDCGSTTSCLVVASGQLATDTLGRVEISELSECFRSEMVFTPFDGPRIDTRRFSEQLDAWLAEASLVPGAIFSGGALITGLAAQRDNAAAITTLVSGRLADAVVAAAGAPRLESWLAFMGNCHELSLAHADTPILNLDLGGGTTNLALGQNGQVAGTGSLFVGARHFRFAPGSYRLQEISSLGAMLLKELAIPYQLGQELPAVHVAAIVDFYVQALVSTITDDAPFFKSERARAHVQAPLEWPPVDRSRLAITLSGGVGQLVYQLLADGTMLSHQTANAQNQFRRTEFGDLGGELASAIAHCPMITDRLTLIPEGLGRATVFGLLRHSTQLSGSTIYLPEPASLPLASVPIVGRLNADSSAAEITRLLELASETTGAAAIQLELTACDVQTVRRVGEVIASQVERHPLPSHVLLVWLVEPNIGKVLGGYISRWSTLKVSQIVLDEVPMTEAQFVRIGRMSETVVPLWMYAVR